MSIAGVTATRHPRDAHRRHDRDPASSRCLSFRRPRIPSTGLLGIGGRRRQLELRAEIDEADVGHVAVGQLAYATADAYGERKLPVRITRVTRELGRKTVRDDDPRARVDTRVLEVIASFEGAPAVALPLGLRMELHLDSSPARQ